MKKVVAISEQARAANYMLGAAEVYAEMAKRVFDEVLAAAAQADPQKAMKTLETILGTLELAKDALNDT